MQSSSILVYSTTQARYCTRPATNLHLQMLYGRLCLKTLLGQLDKALDGGSLVHRIPWQRGITYNDICRLYTNYVIIRYGHAIIVFDGYQEELSTKYAKGDADVLIVETPV